MKYTLNIIVDKAGRQFLIENRQTIIIVFKPKNTDKFSVSSVSFSPFSDDNDVIFSYDLFTYASLQLIKSFDIININSKSNVIAGNVYEFNGIDFVYKKKAYSDDVCGIKNQSKNDFLTSGLGQKITVLNKVDDYVSNIVKIPKTQTAYFQTSTILWIFVAKGISSNMIIPTQILSPIQTNSAARPLNEAIDSQLVVGNYLEIDLKETTSIKFDPLINAFKK